MFEKNSFWGIERHGHHKISDGSDPLQMYIALQRFV